MNKFGIVVLVTFLVAGCETIEHPSPATLKTRAIESRDLEGKFDDAYKATLQVFQNYGYVIKSSDYAAGVIQGETGGELNHWDGMSVHFEMTATIEQFGENIVKERISLIKKKKNIARELAEIVEDPALFQELYSDIQKEMFLRENLKK